MNFHRLFDEKEDLFEDGLFSFLYPYLKSTAVIAAMSRAVMATGAMTRRGIPVAMPMAIVRIAPMATGRIGAMDIVPITAVKDTDAATAMAITAMMASKSKGARP